MSNNCSPSEPAISAENAAVTKRLIIPWGSEASLAARWRANCSERPLA